MVLLAKYYLFELLICIVARFALYKPFELGWDTSLMVIPQALTDKAPLMSFDVPYEELDVGHDWHNHYWRLKNG